MKPALALAACLALLPVRSLAAACAETQQRPLALKYAGGVSLTSNAALVLCLDSERRVLAVAFTGGASGKPWRCVSRETAAGQGWSLGLDALDYGQTNSFPYSRAKDDLTYQMLVRLHRVGRSVDEARASRVRLLGAKKGEDAEVPAARPDFCDAPPKGFLDLARDPRFPGDPLVGTEG